MPKLSPSTGDRLLTKGALEVWARHRELGNQPKESTASQIEGRLWHAQIFGKAHDVKVIDAPDFKTKVAREARDLVQAEGNIAVAKPKLEALKEPADRLRGNLIDLGFNLENLELNEVELAWTEELDDGTEVECKGYGDHIDPNNDRYGPVIMDVKTGKATRTLDECIREIHTSHAMLQEPSYRAGAEVLYSIPREDWTFIYAFCETGFPNQIVPVYMASDFRELAHLRWRRALHAWWECLSKGPEVENWPPLFPEPQLVTAPGWLLAHELELEAIDAD